MGHKFSLILSREITDEESVTLKEAGGGSAVFLTDTLPTNASVTVTRVDFDDSSTPTLAESIESALEAAKKVPDLTVSPRRALVSPGRKIDSPLTWRASTSVGLFNRSGVLS